jgi:fibronectin-binding autotransporter adhesin
MAIGNGGLAMSGGTLQLGLNGGSGIICQVNLGGDFTGSATSNITNPNTDGPRLLDLQGATRVFNITGGTTTINPTIQNGGLTKTGSGLLVLAGANSYTGATQIDAGTLKVRGSLGNTAVTVANNATLAGAGSIAGSVAIGDGGHLAPGNSLGALSTGSLALASASMLDFDLGAPNLGNSALSDRVDVTGSLVLDGILNVTAGTDFGAPQAGDRWRLFNYSTGLTDAGLDLGVLPTLASGLIYFVDTSAFGRVDLAVGTPEQVPEPAGVVLLALGSLGLFARRLGGRR